MIREMLGTKGMALERTNRGWCFTIDGNVMPLAYDKRYHATREELMEAMIKIGIDPNGISTVAEQPYPAGREPRL